MPAGCTPIIENVDPVCRSYVRQNVDSLRSGDRSYGSPILISPLDAWLFPRAIDDDLIEMQNPSTVETYLDESATRASGQVNRVTGCWFV